MCDFPAKELLTARRDAGLRLQGEPETAAALIRAIDEVRWNHEERTGCDCWRQARADSPAQPEVANG